MDRIPYNENVPYPSNNSPLAITNKLYRIISSSGTKKKKCRYKKIERKQYFCLVLETKKKKKRKKQQTKKYRSSRFQINVYSFRI